MLRKDSVVCVVGFIRSVIGTWVLGSCVLVASVSAQVTTDVLFVAQVPQPKDFATIASTFSNHKADPISAPRGGDLYIRYSDGTLKNLTAAAGYGMTGMQGANAIAVRDPAVHWNGTKALFSMVVGAPTQRYVQTKFYWQIYEVSGIGRGQTTTITKVPNQPTTFNNVMPIYGSDGRIIFVSDRPRNGAAHLYPQLDEYESTETNTGIWSIDPARGDLKLLDHAPSGDFHPFIDSFGRIIFTRWDHLQSDQQGGIFAGASNKGYGSVNYASENASATRTGNDVEVFPEMQDPVAQRNLSTIVNPHRINQFFPWQLAQDGSGHETLNHIGRHELVEYFPNSFTNDSNVREFIPTSGLKITNFFQIRENPREQGRYFGINGPEFNTHGGGQIVTVYSPVGLSADRVTVEYITHPDTADVIGSGNHTGFYRNPTPLTSGALIASHSPGTSGENNATGSLSSTFAYRIKTLVKSGTYYTPGTLLTGGLTKSISFWNPDVLVSYNGPLWELQPVEVVARTTPPLSTETALEAPEQAIFNQAGVNADSFRSYLAANNLALIVMRDLTTRDFADRQQPFNLRIPSSGKTTVGASGRIYEIQDLQIFQGDQIRAYTSFNPGRRVLAQTLHDSMAFNSAVSGAVPGSVSIAGDGSAVAVVPANRALSWQLTSTNGSPVVRERYWVTFKSGEIRVCASCHGLNTKGQNNAGVPQNPPAALLNYLTAFKRSGVPLPAVTPTPQTPLLGGATPLPSAIPTIAPGGAGQSYSITVNSTSGRAAKITRAQTGSKYKLKIRTSAARSKFRLTGFVNGVGCSRVLKGFTTKKDGSFALVGEVPPLPAAANIYFNLSINGVNVSGTTLRILPKTSVKGAKVTSRARAKVCEALRNWEE